MNLKSKNQKNNYFILLPTFLGISWLILSASFSEAKTFPFTANQEKARETQLKKEVLAQQFDSDEKVLLLNRKSRKLRRENILEKIERDITQMENSLHSLRESFEQFRSDQSLIQIRGGMEKMHGRHGGMHHGRMHGRRSMQAQEPECPQPRNTMQMPDYLYNQTNPLENTSDNIEAGRILYQLEVQPTCTMCHGSGDGRGMAASGLIPPPRNFTCGETMRSIPDGQLFGIITNGSEGTGMPAFFDLSDDQIWKLILYIRTLAK